VNDFSSLFQKVRGHSLPVRVTGNDFYVCRHSSVDYHNEAPYLMARLKILSVVNQAINEELMAV
jgi:hypothetical protein